MNKYAIILAAGKGTRMKSAYPKVLHELAGKPMIQHVLDNFSSLDLREEYLVVGFEGDQVIDSLSNDYTFLKQEEQLGTGHAVSVVKPYLQGQAGATIIAYGDMPLITGETLNKLFEFHEASKAAATVLTGYASRPFGYGRIIRKNDHVTKIVEEKDATEEEKKIQEVNTGVYIFDNKLLFESLANLTPSNAQGEYYLTDVIEMMKNEGYPVSAMILDNFDESLGINDRVQLAEAEAILQVRTNRQHMLNGVTLIDPATTIIGPDVEIGIDTVIEGNVTILGKTDIGKNSRITSGSRIIDSHLHSGVVVNQSTVEGTVMEMGSDCGPYAHLRPGTILHEGVHVGNFVEVKGSSLGRGTKAGHLTYIGDAVVGEKVNFGAGTITVNYDGKNKYKTEIESFAFIGSNSTLIAPIHIGKNALTAAGSTITNDVQEDSLAIGRAKQVDKLDRAKTMPHYKGD